MGRQHQAWRLVARSFVGLAVSCALALQLLLIGLAYGSLAGAAPSADDPFAICYGGGDDSGTSGHTPGQPASPLHCLLACVQAHGGGTPPLPSSVALLQVSPVSTTLGPRADAILLPAQPDVAHPPRGPPTSA